MTEFCCSDVIGTEKCTDVPILLENNQFPVSRVDSEVIYGSMIEILQTCIACGLTTSSDASDTSTMPETYARNLDADRPFSIFDAFSKSFNHKTFIFSETVYINFIITFKSVLKPI